MNSCAKLLYPCLFQFQSHYLYSSRYSKTIRSHLLRTKTFHFNPFLLPKTFLNLAAGKRDDDRNSDKTTKQKLQEKPQQFYTDMFRTPSNIEMQTIGTVKSPYKERFGTPRQPVITTGVLGGEAQMGEVIFQKNENFEQALEDLEGFEYCWLITYFHLNKGWNPKVKPPRGAEDGKKGLFATRSPHRPNNIGLSAVKIHSVDTRKGILRVIGHDLLDGTPVLDVKPYVPYCDAFPSAKAGWLEKINKEHMREADNLGYWPPPSHIK
eukprot:CAMPEP_0117739812 /NCGR_PEP_ID=MMETSP0947-20121206/3980_1 /TAXON_ID=44440 /ORGANISM="Chattonella subsalsa, Strain CCMP2191" /LENGTH=265 /DNA_ID=CAMNT_0005555829 /DNA_START=138 /DNA_END=935 /DNA_ORIENTATION=-